MTTAEEIEIRPIREEERDAVVALDELAFHARHEDARRAGARAELERIDGVGAFAGDELVGFAGAWPFDLTIPGGELACAGVTWVAVAPTHRRRGILRGMIEALLDRATDGGRPLAALFAAEGGIYGRFGFGAATRTLSLAVEARGPLALRVEPSTAPLRLLDATSALAVIRPLHDELRPRRGGRPSRDEAWWREHTLLDDDRRRTLLQAVVLGAPGAEEGYAIYQAAVGRFPSDRVRISLRELEARTPAGVAALWRYLTSIDLVDGVDTGPAAEDDPLLALAVNGDDVIAERLRPMLWLRILDVPAALAARSWAAPVDVVLELTDAGRPANAGRWHVTPGSCSPTEQPADLRLDVRELGAAFLGASGTLARHLAVGLLEERTAGAVAALDAALAVVRQPHDPEHW